MTVPVTSAESVYTLGGTSSLGPFATAWTCEGAADIAVYLDVGLGPVALTAGVQFTVNFPGGDPQANGGTVTLNVSLLGGLMAWPAGTVLTLDRQTGNDQPSALGDAIGFSPEAYEAALDHVERQVQDLRVYLNRSIQAPAGETFGPLPARAFRLGKLLGFDAVLGNLSLVPPGSYVTAAGPNLFANVASAAAATIAAGTQILRTAGFATAGDGGDALYIYSAGVPPIAGSYFRSADGAYWVLTGARNNVMQFGALGIGLDDAPAIRAAIAFRAGRDVEFPAGTYTCNSPIGVIPANTALLGAGKYATKLLCNYSGATFLNLATNATLRAMTVSGGGGFGNVPAGKVTVGVQMDYPSGGQILDTVDVTGFAATCVYFTITHVAPYWVSGGSRARLLDCSWWRSDGVSGSGNYGLVIQDITGAVDAGTGGSPKHIQGCDSAGYCFGDFSAANDVYVVASTVFDIKTTQHTADLTFASSRFAPPVGPIDLYGSGSAIGCDFGQPVIIHAGSAWNLGPGFFNQGWTDNSTPGESQIYDVNLLTYVPEFSFGGTPIVVGNGTVRGWYQRTGSHVTFSAQLLLGTTTAIPTHGPLAIGLDETMFTTEPQLLVSGNIQHAGAFYPITGAIIAGNTCSIYAATDTVPAALGAGDLVQISGAFMRG